MKNFLNIDKDVMPVGGYIAPTPRMLGGDFNTVTDKVYKDMKSCGLNFIDSLSISYDSHKSYFIKQLKLAEKYGIKLLVGEKNNVYDDSYNAKKLIDGVSRYKDYPAFAGIHGCDEPCGERIRQARERKRDFDAAFKNKEFYVNLLPNYAKDEMLADENYSGGDKYDYYINNCINTIQPDYISFDYYPFVSESPYILPGYFKNLGAIAKISQKKGIPFLSCMQATSWNEAYARYVTLEEMNWQVKTNLLFGCRGIIYFTYAVPICDLPENETFRQAIIDKQGKRTERFYYAKKNNDHIKSIQHILMNSDLKGIIRVGDTPDELPEDMLIADYKEYLSLTGKHILIGCFDYKNDTVLYILNNSITEKDKFTLKLNKICDADIYYDTKKTSKAGKTFTKGLDAGNACLIHIKSK